MKDILYEIQKTVIHFNVNLSAKKNKNEAIQQIDYSLSGVT